MVKKIRLTKKQYLNPCSDCGGKNGAICCVGLSIDTPERTKKEIDLDSVYWYLTRPSFFATTTLKNGIPSLHPSRWELSVADRCEHLEKNNRCNIYDQRPHICSDYSPFPLKKPEDNVNSSGYCDRYEPEMEKVVFKRSKDFLDYIQINFPKKMGGRLKKRKPLKYDNSKLLIIKEAY